MAKDNLDKVINQAILDLRTADKNYTAYQLTYQTNKNAYAVVQERFNLGLVNQIDYDTALTNLNKAYTGQVCFWFLKQAH